MWDEIVDVVSVGAGPGGLACAVAAVDAGLDVFVAVPGAGTTAGPAPDVDGPRGWLPVVSDEETMAYFDALVEELPTVAPGEPAALSVRALREVEVDTSRRARVETFVGSRLGTWAAGSIASPYGVLFTRVEHWPTATMRSTNDISFQVATLDEAAGTRPASTFADRLDAMVADRDIPVFDDHRLQRIVFEEGRIVGVVVDSPDGPWAVRADVGIAVTTEWAGQPDTRILDPGSRIALVGMTASRFGRVEVLSTADVSTAAEMNSA